MRIGMFGGTFDPVHLGHLRACLEVREHFELDRVYLVPSAVPPHKVPGRVTDAATRIAMLQAAVAGDPAFVVSPAELNREGPSYTIDTVRAFQADFRPDQRLFLIIGLDAFLEIDTWKSYPELLSRVVFLVMLRPGEAESGGEAGMADVQRFVTERISDRYRFSAESTRFVHPDRPPIYLTRVTAMGISSTQVRGLVRARKSIRYLVPEAVERIIYNRGLYQ